MSDIISQEQYPWITFKLRGQDYCVSSKTVYTMTMPEKYHPLPEAGAGVLGLMTLGKDPIPVVSIRALLGMPLLQEDLDKFSVIKLKHLSWLEGLKECIATGGPFTLPLDVHECELGVWHDNFHTNNHSLKRISEQLAEPHARLHIRTRELLEQRATGVQAQESPLFREILDISKRRITPLLEKLDSAYRDTNRGVVIVLERDDRKAGAQVDRIAAVLDFEGAQRKPRQDLGFGEANFVKNVIVGTDGQVFLELDVDALLGATPMN